MDGKVKAKKNNNNQGRGDNTLENGQKDKGKILMGKPMRGRTRGGGMQGWKK